MNPSTAGFLAAWVVVFAFAATAQAQSLGILSWQLLPYCNRVVLGITQQGGSFILNGIDDQCGAAQAGTAVGVAVPQGGAIAVNLHIVVAGAADLHVRATIDAAANYSGSWTDSAGASGQFMLAWNTGGPPRPLPALPQMRVTGACGAGSSIRAVGIDGTVVCETGTGGDITAVVAGTGLTGGGTSGAVTLAVNTGAIQSRIATACASGSAIRQVNVDGTVACQTDTNAGGDITSVTAGIGLSGGATHGDAALAVNFGGPGSATAAARSDHTHAIAGIGNTAVGVATLSNNTTGTNNTGGGFQALLKNGAGVSNTAFGTSALEANTSGSSNTAVGVNALTENTLGAVNTAVGADALRANHSGNENTAVGRLALSAATASGNTAVGHGAMLNTTSGSVNTGLGNYALLNNMTGASNTAVGSSTLSSSTTGGYNIALGQGAGGTLTSGSHNIYIKADAAASSESRTLRIGSSGGADGTITRAFVSGIYNVAVGSGHAVTVSASGQLGLASSSRRYKADIAPLSTARTIVQALRPVQFTYKPEFTDGVDTGLHYGLVAEDAAAVDPNLGIWAGGRLESVRYEFLPPLLLAEIQRLEEERATLTAQVTALDAQARANAAELAELRARVEVLLRSVTAPRNAR